jgi:Ca-activated chloride channel family protein
MMRASAYAALCVGVAVIGFRSTPAARQVQSPPVLSVKTDLVTLPVAVLDRRGDYVTGLRPEHFTVYDGGERQTIQFFTSEDLPATIGLVVDASGSMGARRIEVAVAAAAFVRMRHRLDEFFTINFNEAVWPGLPADVAFTDDADQLVASISAAPARGLSALYDALDRALDHLQRGSRDRRALIVVSDGGDNASRQTVDGVVAHARRTASVIYAVALIDPDNREARPGVLKKLADGTGGRVFTPKRSADVMTAFEQIAGAIRSGYVIGYTPPDSPTPAFRTVRVIVDAGDGRRLVARTRAGYHAGPPDSPPE